MRGANRRRPTESFNQPPPPQPTPDLYGSRFGGSRDSDASFASSRPSSAGIGRVSIATDLYSDRSHQSSAIRAINAFLSSHSFQILLPPKQVPSVKDIMEIIKFLVTKLDYPSTAKFEDDLFVILKSLNCPIKINKSTLRSPNSPHNWPSYLALIHWLVQIASYTNHLLNSSSSFAENNSMYLYALESYLNYIRGDDDSVEELDKEFIGKVEKERDSVSDNVIELEKKVKELEEKKAEPTEREKLEKEKSVLEEDVNKFNAMIAEFNTRIEKMEKVVQGKEREMADKVEEHKRICEENEELKKRVELQTFNARDMERMRRELQAVERDIGDAETARNAWEDKNWDLDALLGQKFKELEALSMECNHAIRRLKLGIDIQYVLNAKGSTPAEVMGIDCKSTLKPALESFADDIKKSSMAKYEELISLQQQSSEMATKIEGKRIRIGALQSHIDEMEAQLNLFKKEMQEHAYRCAAESRKMADDVKLEAQNLDMVEKEAAEVLKVSELKLKEAIRQSEEEIQLRACELFALVDSVSKYKEYMESKISDMKGSLSETALTVSEAYKNSLPPQVGKTFDASS
ncbi:kinetochore protein NDC80 homolog [Mangifera indica]|uniref:kinetochore protein NDC80 homolog n=1 Tax=Mangifera indica TaxID=29780 RepID=UPI001CFA8141|nr:kinetochore protein NDC80 homolog [Mangifera indica]